MATVKVTKIEVSREDFKALVKEFTGTSGWRSSNNRGEFVSGKEDSEDPRRKLRSGNIIFVEAAKAVDVEE